MKNLLKKQIRQLGPMPLYEYMMLALYHPQKGYYTSKKPFGNKGDFITAPEISPVFGELICGWIIDVWIKLGQPNPFNLVELGPGRGYLMSDIIRTAKIYEPFYQAIAVHLIEISPALRKEQQNQINFENISWHDDSSSLPKETSIFLGNEFFDALPIRQFQRKDNQWCEVYIDYNEDEDKFYFTHVKQVQLSIFPDLEDGSIIEVNETAIKYCQEIVDHLKKYSGIALFFDYGNFEPNYKNSLRSYCQHQNISPLEKPGESDITAHVDFQKLAMQIKNSGLEVQLTTQKNWLKNMGIHERMQALKQQSHDAGKLDEIVKILISEDEMGDIFKAMSFSNINLQLLGFNV